jgi:hypothetical protein
VAPLGAHDLLKRNTAAVATRIAARLITGPAAFLLGGVIDVVVYATGVMRAKRRPSP